MKDKQPNNAKQDQQEKLEILLKGIDLDAIDLHYKVERGMRKVDSAFLAVTILLVIAFFALVIRLLPLPI